jgi:hypothetical protein
MQRLYANHADQVRLVATGLEPGDARLMELAHNVLPELVLEYQSLKRIHDLRLAAILDKNPDLRFSV